MSTQLNQSNLKQLRADVRVPSYDRSKVGQSIVHIGVGGFHRAHQALYADELLSGDGDRAWGLCGLGLLKHDQRLRDVFANQDCLYTLVSRGSAGDEAQVVGSIVRFLFAPENPEAVIERLCSPETRIVSLTITEGGYYINQATGQFDQNHPDIQYDLAHPTEPRCSFGYLAEALQRRKSRGEAPFTLMSCDNLQGNGDVLKRMLLAFTELRDPSLHNWVAQEGAFPNSMVDRITPATTDEHRAMVRDKFGIEDGWPVVAEPFRQWVIEDHFLHGRPQWETVGAQMTGDVLPYEKMKIRLLNASHQAMCYIGMLLGYTVADETMSDRQIRRLVESMMNDEVTPLLPPVPGVDLADYKATLIERFSNPAIRDQLPRLGTEGSARIPKFVLPSVSEALARGSKIDLLTFTVAAWFRYLTGKDDEGKEMPIIDPMKQELQERAIRGGKEPQELLGMSSLFGDLAHSAVFVKQLTETLHSFYEQGAKATLTRFVGT